MSRFRGKPGEVEAHQWHRNGDHPADYDVPDFTDPVSKVTYTAEYRRQQGWEGAVVRYFRHPHQGSSSICSDCGKTYHWHGWIDSGENGHKVCPGDWIVDLGMGAYFPVNAELLPLIYDEVADLEGAGRVRG